jgi:hypothetical protein
MQFMKKGSQFAGGQGELADRSGDREAKRGRERERELDRKYP